MLGTGLHSCGFWNKLAQRSGHEAARTCPLTVVEASAPGAMQPQQHLNRGAGRTVLLLAAQSGTCAWPLQLPEALVLQAMAAPLQQQLHRHGISFCMYN